MVTNYRDEKFLKKYQIKTEEQWYTLYRPIIQMLGNLEGKRVLDIGCGSGYLSYELFKQGANVVGIDISDKWIEFCKEKYPTNEKLNFFLADGKDLKMFENENFDAVICNMVFLNVPKKTDVRKIFNEASRVLKKGADFIFSDLHPICLMTENMPTRFQEYGRNFSYFKDGSEYNANIRLPNGEIITFKNKHWTLETYTKFLEESSMNIYRIIESQYPKDTPKKFYKYNIPEYIIFHCKKF